MDKVKPFGDGSPEALVNLGDVVLINTSDGVFTGREPHTSPQTINDNKNLYIKAVQPLLKGIISS